MCSIAIKSNSFSPSYVAAALDPETRYKHNFCSKPEFSLALTDAIEKMAQTSDEAVRAIQEISVFRECLGRFNRPIARAGASSMSPCKSHMAAAPFSLNLQQQFNAINY